MRQVFHLLNSTLRQNSVTDGQALPDCEIRFYTEIHEPSSQKSETILNTFTKLRIVRKV